MSLRIFYEEHKALSIVIVLIIFIALYQSSSFFRSEFSSATGGIVSFDSAVSDGVLKEDKTINRSAGVGAILPTSPQYFGSGENIVIEDEKIIKTAFMNVEVDSVDSALPAIENIAKSLGGFTVNSSASEDTAGTRKGAITVKVPVDTFDSARAQIKEVSVFIQNENVNSRDVTEEFIDIEARLRNLRAQEASYLTLLNRATKIEDIITITSSLTNVRTQIEQTEGRKRYLEGQTDFSTISVSLSEEHGVTLPSRKWRPLTVIQDAARNTVNQLQGFVDNSIEFFFWAIGIIPYLLILVVLLWVIKRYKR